MGALEAMKPTPKKAYIAGPMTGIEDDNFPAFYKVEKELGDRGYEVINPAQFGHGGTWLENMQRDIPLVMGCDTVVVLAGWHKSKGARLEVAVARELEIPILHEGDLGV